MRMFLSIFGDTRGHNGRVDRIRAAQESLVVPRRSHRQYRFRRSRVLDGADGHRLLWSTRHNLERSVYDCPEGVIDLHHGDSKMHAPRQAVKTRSRASSLRSRSCTESSIVSRKSLSSQRSMKEQIAMDRESVGSRTRFLWIGSRTASNTTTLCSGTIVPPPAPKSDPIGDHDWRPNTTRVREAKESAAIAARAAGVRTARVSVITATIDSQSSALCT